MPLKAFVRSEGINEDRIIAILLGLLAFGLVFVTISDIGVTIDEPYVNREAGTNFATWLMMCLEDIINFRFLHIFNEESISFFFRDPYLFHPPFGRTLLGTTGLLFSESIGEIPAYRLATAILFSVSVGVLYIMTSHCYGKWAGIAASLSLVCMPHAFGLAHIMGLDSMIASMWLITIFTFWKGLNSRKWAFFFAITLAACVNTKVHGYFLIPLLIFWGMFAHYHKSRWNFIFLVSVTPVFFLIFNPTLWHHTLKNLFVFLGRFVHREEMQQIPSYFLGEKYDFNMPWYYPFYLSGITVPPMILLVGLIGMVYLLYRFDVKGKLKSENPAFILILSIFFLLGLFTAKFIPNYDGVRLFLPVFPCFAFLVGAGFSLLAAKLSPLFPEAGKRYVAQFLLLVLIVPSAISLWRIHPYELSYYNVLVGGLPGAEKKGLELTYWNDPFNLDVVADFNERFSGKAFNRPAGIWRNVEYYQELGLLSPTIGLRDKGNDYSLVSYRQGWFTPQEWFYYHYFEPEYKVEAEGVTLFAVFPAFEKERQRKLGRLGVVEVSEGTNGSKKTEYLLKIDEEGMYDFGLYGNRFVRISLDGKEFLKIVGPQKSLKRTSQFLPKGLYSLSVAEHRGADPFYLAWRKDGRKLGLVGGENLIAVK